MKQTRTEVVAWVGSNIVPHEADLRARLRKMGVPDQEISDVVQDAYLSISQMASVSHIRNGRGYFFQTARMALLQRIRRERIVRIDSLTEMQALALEDDDPGPERHVSARLELAHIRLIISDLPTPCREIFELRRIQGMSQRETAERLDVSEHVVESQAARGLKLILNSISGGATNARPGRKVKGASRDSHTG